MKKAKYSKEVIGHDWVCDICNKDINSESDIAHHFKTDDIDDVCHDCIKIFPTPVLSDPELRNTELVDIICDCISSCIGGSDTDDLPNLNHGIYSLWYNGGYRFIRKHESRDELEKFIRCEIKDEDDGLLEVLADGKPLNAEIHSIITYNNKEMGW